MSSSPCSRAASLEELPKAAREGALASGRFVHCRQDGGKPLLRLATQFRMREHIEFVLADRVENLRCDKRWVDAGTYLRTNMGSQRSAGACGIRYPHWTIAFLPIASGLVDAGPHISGTKHAHADA